MDQDQLWKDLLRAFMPDFLRLFLPDVAERLDLETVRFQDKETFTDLPKGLRREADLVAEVRSSAGEPELILVHVEIQGRRDAEMAQRMWEYYHLLRLRHRKPVVPIVLYLVKGRAGLARERYVDRLFGMTYATQTYWAISLPSFAAARFLKVEPIFGAAVSSVMRPGRLSRAMHKLQVLHRIARGPIDAARRDMLVHMVGEYLHLNPEQEAEMNRLITDTGAEEVREMVNEFEARGIEKGIERGIERGIAQGIRKGHAVGRLDGQRSIIWDLIEARFPSSPTDVKTQLDRITDSRRLTELAQTVLTAKSLADLKLQD
ncbi:MAG: Rpn family recombination-promoting nuclease/putative transposase [Armatimonadetes bacterium]|nr:Rpn family recombination-promoting nuclease/putative transposase [Armatimonadota bacterium]